MDLPDGIKIPGAKLIAHGKVNSISVGLSKYEEGIVIPKHESKMEFVNERGWVIFVPEPKGEK